MLKYSISEKRSSRNFEIDPDIFHHPYAAEASNAVLSAWISAVALSYKWGTQGLLTEQEVRSLAPRLRAMRGHQLWFKYHKDQKIWELLNLKTFTRVKRTRQPIPQSVRQTIYARDGHACLTCGATERLTLDHIYPWSLGGSDTMENLQTLCWSCNSRKGARV